MPIVAAPRSATRLLSPHFPIVAIIHSLMDHEGRPRDEVLGPPLCRIFERSAVGPLPPNAPPPPSLRVFGLRASKLLGWLVTGLNRPTPFFDDRTRVLRAEPHVLTPSERAAPLKLVGLGLFLRNRFWERLMVNVGIVLVFAGFS
jgi:hypothetical protein